MEKEIIAGDIGSLGKFDVAFTGGKLIATGNLGYDGASVAVTLTLDSDGVLDAIAKAIPGQIDDAVISVVKAALKA